MEWLLEGWKMGERKWYIWSLGWAGKEVRFWWGQEPKNQISHLMRKLKKFWSLLLQSLQLYFYPHLQCSTLQLLHLSFDLFCFLLSSLSSFAGFFFFFNVTFLSSYNNIHCLYIHVLCYSFSISKGPWFFPPTWKHLLYDSI